MTTAPLYVHVGFPKTATTTLQAHLFPRHPELDYLGKFIPDFGFVDGLPRHCLDALITEPEAAYEGVEVLAEWIAQRRRTCDRKAVLLSSESFVHVTAADTKAVACRLRRLAPDTRIIITLREQASMLRSFYETHGCYGQYLFLVKSEREEVSFPISFDQWIKLQFRAPYRNILALLRYDGIVKIFDEAFGRHRVGVFLYEELATDPAAFTDALCTFLGIDAAPAHELLIGRHENPGRPERALDPRGERPVYCSPAFEDPQWLTLDRTLSDTVKEQIAAWFRVGNQRLATVRNLPLAAHGYPC